MKRSHIITLTLSRLPPPHLLPPAIYSMDTTVLDREDLQVWRTARHKARLITNGPADFVLPSHSLRKQRLQVIMPTDEELRLIEDAKSQNPNSPLAPAELCLLTLGQISYLSSRLQLWAFVLDYDSLERVCSCAMTTSQIYINAGFGFSCCLRMLWTYPPPFQEIAEPLFHLKLAMEQLSASQTFRYILATVLAIGNFLNGRKVSLP